MKIQFLAVGELQRDTEIIEESVNSFDLSAFPEGAEFSGNAATVAAGIINVERVNSELRVTLGQCGLAYECQSINGSHDWRSTGEWFNAADYDPDRCYIVATSAPADAEYVKRDQGWTVAIPEPEPEPDELEPAK